MSQPQTVSDVSVSATELTRFEVFGLLDCSPDPPDNLSWQSAARFLLGTDQVRTARQDSVVPEATGWRRAADRPGRALFVVVRAPGTDGGGLLVLPGSHRASTLWETEGERLADPSAHFGLVANDLPADRPLLRATAVILDAYCWHNFDSVGDDVAYQVARFEAEGVGEPMEEHT